MEQRDFLLSKYPDVEGKWLVTSVQPFTIAILPNERMAKRFEEGFGLETSFCECLGRETVEQSDEEDGWDSKENKNHK
jgi:hypothetical protein